MRRVGRSRAYHQGSSAARIVVLVASIALLSAACGGTSKKPTTTTVGSNTPTTTTTTLPATTTIAPTTTVAPTTTTTTTAPAATADQVATEFLKAFYTWSTTEFELPASSINDVLVNRCKPFVSPGLDTMLTGVLASPETSADKIDWTPQTVSNAKSQVAPAPTASSVAYIAEVGVRLETIGYPSSSFNVEAQVALHLIAGAWKVTAVNAAGATGPTYSGAAAGAFVRLGDPAYGSADQQLG